jgi:hypothetical protein
MEYVFGLVMIVMIIRDMWRKRPRHESTVNHVYKEIG